MLFKWRVIRFLCIIILLSPGSLLIAQNAEGAVLTDYDIRIDSSLVHLRYLDGNTGSMNLTLVNQCVHQLTITVTTEGAGIMTLPSDTTIVLGNGIGTTRDLSISATLPYGSPAGTYEFTIHTRITRADGAFIENGKERHASVVVLAHRHLDVSIGTGHLQALKGTAVKGIVELENLGNAPDLFETATVGDITFLPAVDYMRVDHGGVIQFPVILIASHDARDSSITSIDLMVTSLCDDEFRMNGTVIIEVVDAEDELDPALNDRSGSGAVLLLALGGILSLAIIAVHLRRANNAIGSIVLFLLLSSAAMSTFLPPDHAGIASAQVVPEVELTIERFPSLDTSPLAPDESSVGVFNVTYSDGEPDDHVIRCIIDAPGYVFGSVQEHRVRSNESITFTVAIGRFFNHGYSQSGGSVFVEDIEHQGVPFSGYNSQSGFFILSESYSIPMLSIDTPILDPSDGDKVTAVIGITNHGSRNDGLRLSVEDNSSLEEQGFDFSHGLDPMYLDRNESRSTILEISVPGNPPSDMTVIRVSASGEETGNFSAVGGAVLVFLHDGGDDGGSDIWEDHGIVLVLPPLCIVIIAVLFIRWKRSGSENF